MQLGDEETPVPRENPRACGEHRVNSAHSNQVREAILSLVHILTRCYLRTCGLIVFLAASLIPHASLQPFREFCCLYPQNMPTSDHFSTHLPQPARSEPESSGAGSCLSFLTPHRALPHMAARGSLSEIKINSVHPIPNSQRLLE